MNIIVELVIKFWYLWFILIVISVLKIFKPKINGYLGEKSVARSLSKLNKERYKVINNLMLRVGDKTTQIDHVVISNYGIFVIETKNYSGWIVGNEFDDYWNQIIFKRKERLYSPIKQNYGHIKALKENLQDFSNINFISIIVFTTKADLKVNSKTDVVYTTKLKKTIKKYKNITLNNVDKEEIYSQLVSLNINNKENRKAHVKLINEEINRRSNALDKDRCPKCGGKLILRKGKYGEFKGCSNFPKCRFTLKL
ncbi:NERD domain-containing protein [Inconstantimicrobium mannanitabidum]|uniref:Uncharacterized protein n=1 Tax=Inconstantimicrobium mannanitabidum TaxID=1604901 RepID=A0ACB5RAS1_9CLOT|nr:NERD domain-containing protein [Clostridium sp. TW13]GKX66222.1 hypothetical protein rsdtw13_14800 [Clostridium sp. TW13]